MQTWGSWNYFLFYLSSCYFWILVFYWYTCLPTENEFPEKWQKGSFFLNSFSQITWRRTAISFTLASALNQLDLTFELSRYCWSLVFSNKIKWLHAFLSWYWAHQKFLVSTSLMEMFWELFFPYILILEKNLNLPIFTARIRFAHIFLKVVFQWWLTIRILFSAVLLGKYFTSYH